MSLDMTYNEIFLLKKDILTFLEYLEKYSKQKNFQINQNDRDFFIFISKRIVFFKTINSEEVSLYPVKVLVSDMYNLILTIIANQKRYIYLNERSIIENYMRLILKKSLENDHITANLFDTLKHKYPTIFTDTVFSLLKSEYCISCGYVHGGSDLNQSLISYFIECIETSDSLTARHKYYDRLKKIIHCYEQSLIYSHGTLIDAAFHRKKSVLAYLLGSKYVDLLFQLKGEMGF